MSEYATDQERIADASHFARQLASLIAGQLASLIVEQSFAFTIIGAPRTKKNSGRIVTRGRHPRILPSKAYELWDAAAQVQLASMRSQAPGTFPISANVNCSARFYRDALRGDAVGFYQALADTLEKAGIVENDSQIVSWNGSRLMKDSENPRVEFTLEVL